MPEDTPALLAALRDRLAPMFPQGAVRTIIVRYNREGEPAGLDVTCWEPKPDASS